jgi:hypothetical protein
MIQGGMLMNVIKQLAINCMITFFTISILMLGYVICTIPISMALKFVLCGLLGVMMILSTQITLDI